MGKLYAVLLVSLFTVSAGAESLRVSIGNIESATGSIVLAVFDKPDHWLDTKAKESPFREATYVVESTDDATIVIDIPAGRYAISVFHDLNDNKKLDTNFIGYPKEPFGFSAPMGRFGPPKFEVASIKVGAQDNKIIIELN